MSWRSPKFVSIFLLLSLAVSACAGYDLRPATGATPSPADTGETPAVETAAPGQIPSLTATPTGAWLSLSPASGKPGDTVRIDGYNPHPPAQADLQGNNYHTYLDVCWDGCQNGLVDQALETTWSQTDPGHFSLSFIVPSTPWLALDGPHALSAGDYPLSIQYLDVGSTACSDPTAKGCVVNIDSSLSFHLDEGSTGPACSKPDCGSLAVAPGQGVAGDTIQVSGWAPLLGLIGGTPAGYSGYSLVLLGLGTGADQQNQLNYGAAVTQLPDGSLTASFDVPLSGQNGPLPAGTYTLGLNADSLQAAQGKGGSLVLVASTQFTVTDAPAWSQLSLPAPLWIDPAASITMDQSMAIEAAQPTRMAYCAAGSIRLSQDGGGSWTDIPTGAVAGLADTMGYSMDQQPQPKCNSVTLDSAYPGSFYAVFQASNKQYGAPPIYFMGFFTTDGGKTWQGAPTPPDEGNPPMVERFGGFSTDGKTVLALYSGNSSGNPGDAPVTLVEQTSDGGVTWQAGTLTCPASGPCVRWGAAPGSISGMGAGLPQFVMTSDDNGQTWSFTGQSVELRMNGPHELAGFSQNNAMWISGDAQYPLLVTQDGGKTWQAYELPLLPGAGQSNGFQYNGLQMLPDGSLVAMNNGTGAWYALEPAAQDWCALTFSMPGDYPVFLQASGDKVWWFSPVDQSLQSTPLSELGCGK